MQRSAREQLTNLFGPGRFIWVTVQQQVANEAPPRDTPRFVVAFAVALVCVATIAWWLALVLLLRWLVGAIS